MKPGRGRFEHSREGGVGEAIRYLADWRMHIAADLLRTTELTVSAIARRVGYDSEEAFSRAFKRARGEAPSAWRARLRTRG